MPFKECWIQFMGFELQTPTKNIDSLNKLEPKEEFWPDFQVVN